MTLVWQSVSYRVNLIKILLIKNICFCAIVPLNICDNWTSINKYGHYGGSICWFLFCLSIIKIRPKITWRIIDENRININKLLDDRWWCHLVDATSPIPSVKFIVSVYSPTSSPGIFNDPIWLNSFEIFCYMYTWKLEQEL